MRRSIDTIRMRQLLSLHVRYKAVIPNKKYLYVLDEFWALMTIGVAARLRSLELNSPAISGTKLGSSTGPLPNTYKR